MKNNLLFLYRDQQIREADDLISTLDPKNTNKITFDAYIRDNYGDLDLKQLEKMDKSDSRSRETRRVRYSFKFFVRIDVWFCRHIQPINRNGHIWIKTVIKHYPMMNFENFFGRKMMMIYVNLKSIVSSKNTMIITMEKSPLMNI